ncbi:MAG TPA: CHAT domain-containing protein [Streptosporangiaceae bacterium]|nr:CHAT domain-containing protein [Streptosporangiaceae bacterium]
MPSAEREKTLAGAGVLSRDGALRRAGAAHQRGLRAGAAGHPGVGARHLRAGLAALGWQETVSRATPAAAAVPAAHHAFAARLLISLAHLEAEQGRTEYGLDLLDVAEDLTAPGDLGILLSQRGLLLMRTGRLAQALALFDESVPLLEQYADTAVLARVLLNRSVLHLSMGAMQRCRLDLRWCQRIAATGGHELIEAKAAHNLGCCDLLAGDIPAALRQFTAAADGYRLTAPGFLPVLATDRARALLAVGLAVDAASELDSAIVAFRQQRLDQDLAEAELARARAALAAGAPAVAHRWAAAAARRFRRRGNDSYGYVAELTRLRARFATGGRPVQVATEAAALAGRLRGCGLCNDADLAELLAARALIAAGRGSAARLRIEAVRRAAVAGSLEVSLLRRLAKAELAELDGRPGTMLAELRAGLAMVQAWRLRLGSVDFQTGSAALGADLAAAGLRVALKRGSGSLVLAWLERSRAQAFRVRPLRPPADPRLAEVVAELRRLSMVIRTAELGGKPDQSAKSRRAALKREIREHSWQAAGPGSNRPAGQARRREIADALAASGQSLVSILAGDSGMHAVVLRGDSVKLIGLGDFAAAAEAARRLTADLDSMAGRQLPDRLAAVIAESIRHQVGVLTAEIAAPLRPALAEHGGIVFVPAGALASIPWNMLPDFRGRPVSVAPSASSWLAAWRLAGADEPPLPGRPPFLVAGPDLAHAAAEVAQIASIYPGCRPLTADQATVGSTLHGLDGAALAHVAAHGYHDRENFLFSRLELADGPLMAYDIQQLAAAPRQVVLSACDVGRVVVRPGEEILGFTAALLYIGTATVVSSVARVADEAAVAVMTAYHRALATGARPAVALARAGLTEPYSPFVCFGCG